MEDAVERLFRNHCADAWTPHRSNGKTTSGSGTFCQTLQIEPLYEGYRNEYGELAALGIEKGKPLKPNARRRGILEEAARLGNAQMRVQCFGDRRPDRLVWSDRQWQWAWVEA